MLTIYGLKRTTLIDFPGHIACTAFTHGCTLKCPYCHNPELVIRKPDESNAIDSSEFLRFLKKRRGKLEGVVFSGGEPLLQLKHLRPLLKEIKALGYLIKIDTNGTLTEALSAVLKEKLTDFIAMDFKIAPEFYTWMKSTPKKTKAVLKSLTILKRNHVDYEIRTTLVPGMHDEEKLKIMMPYIAEVPKFVLQNFQQNDTIDHEYSKIKPFSREQMRTFLTIARSFNPHSSVRLPD